MNKKKGKPEGQTKKSQDRKEWQTGRPYKKGALCSDGITEIQAV
jgi:hypothetical protein